MTKQVTGVVIVVEITEYNDEMQVAKPREKGEIPFVQADIPPELLAIIEARMQK